MRREDIIVCIVSIQFLGIYLWQCPFLFSSDEDILAVLFYYMTALTCSCGERPNQRATARGLKIQKNSHAFVKSVVRKTWWVHATQVNFSNSKYSFFGW